MNDGLDQNRKDAIISIFKAGTAFLPPAGSLIMSLVLDKMRGQRIDRVADVVRHLDRELGRLKVDVERALENRPELLDLFEEGFFQSIRAATPERREYIAKLLAVGTSSTRADLLRDRRLLAILGDLNDIEILTLRYYNAKELRDFPEQDRLRGIVFPGTLSRASNDDEFDDAAVHSTYLVRLQQLGLIRPSFANLRRGELPEFDAASGAFKPSGHDLTRLGELLLASVGVKTRYHSEEE